MSTYKPKKPKKQCCKNCIYYIAPNLASFGRCDKVGIRVNWNKGQECIKYVGKIQYE